MTATCPNCGAIADRRFVVADYNRRLADERYPYYACRACRLLFLQPIPVDLSAHYADDYHMLPDTVEALAASAEIHERYKVTLVQRFKPAGRVLEIGPGAGGFALLAKRAGYNVSVIEMNEGVCAFISGRLGVPAVHAPDEVQALTDAVPADVIAMWQVIEHLRDPFAVLQVAARKLRPGGILVMAAPNPDALQFKIFGKWWVHLDAPRHVRLIPRELLIEKAVAAGLETVLNTTTDAGSLFWNAFGWDYSLRNRFSIELGTAQRFGRRISRIASVLEKREGWGSAYTVAFRRPER